MQIEKMELKAETRPNSALKKMLDENKHSRLIIKAEHEGWHTLITLLRNGYTVSARLTHETDGDVLEMAWRDK